jgi:hypothetical protein
MAANPTIRGDDIAAIVPDPTALIHTVYLKTGEIIRVNPVHGTLLGAARMPTMLEVNQKLMGK